MLVFRHYVILLFIPFYFSTLSHFVSTFPSPAQAEKKEMAKMMKEEEKIDNDQEDPEPTSNSTRNLLRASVERQLVKERYRSPPKN